MLESIQKFSNSEVYCVTLPDEPEKTRHWFRASELADVLRFSDGYRSVRYYCKDWQYREFQVGKGRPALYVCESGVYRLILRSKAPIALEFQDWLTEELLPKLRAEGGYLMPDATQQQIIELLKRHPHSEHLALAIEYAAKGHLAAVRDELWLEDFHRERKLKELEDYTAALELRQRFPGAMGYVKRPAWLKPSAI